MIGLALSCPATIALAVDYPDEVDETFRFEEGPKWIEGEILIPAYPGANLIEVELELGARARRYFIDADSLSIGEKDSVVRYTIVIRSGNADNVLFEGVRCRTSQYRVYAIGTTNRTFQPVSDTSWHPLSAFVGQRHRSPLANDYLCEAQLPLKRSEIIQRLRVLKPSSSGSIEDW